MMRRHMGSTKHPWRRFAVPLAVLVGTLHGASFARPQGEAPPPAESAPPPAPPSLPGPAPVVEENVTHCGDKQVGTAEGQLHPLGHGFYAEGNRVRRGCTLLAQRPLRERPPVPFSPESFKPLGCGFVRQGTSLYWHQPVTPADTQAELAGERVDVLSRLDLADAATFEVGEECRPHDARFLYLQLTDQPSLPAFVAVPRDEGAGYEELGCGFVRYSGRVFFGTRVVEGAHAPSFTSVQGRLPLEECGEGLYGKDQSRVWWQHEPLRAANAKVFRVPREENPGYRVACSGRRSFQLATVEKTPHALCRGAVKKPARRGH